MIDVRDLQYSFSRDRRTRANSAKLTISRLTISEGSWIYLSGANGSGKSTFMKILLGILRPDRGSVTVCDLDAYRERRRLMKDTGVVWGHRSTLWWDATGNDAIQALNSIYGNRGGRLYSLQQDLINRLGTQDYMARPIRTLSLGQRQRIELLGALSQAPKRLFLDEPFVGLDNDGVECVRSVLQEFYSNSMLLIIDHEGNAPSGCSSLTMENLSEPILRKE